MARVSKGERRRAANIPTWVPSQPPTPCDRSLRYYVRLVSRYEETLQAVEAERDVVEHERDRLIEERDQAEHERDAALALEKHASIS